MSWEGVVKGRECGKRSTNPEIDIHVPSFSDLIGDGHLSRFKAIKQ